MRILIINQHIFDGIGGSEMQCHLIASGFSKKGHFVTYGVVGNRKKEEYDFDLYNILPLDINNKNHFRSQLLKINPDIIYWRYNKNGLFRSSELFMELKIPYVFAISHINDVTKYSYKVRHSTGLLSNLKINLSYLKQMLVSARNYSGLIRANVVTSLNSSFVSRSPNPNTEVVWNSVPETIVEFKWNKPYICWVANIKADKRPELFLSLAKKIGEVFPNIDFLMIGDIRQDYYFSFIKDKQLELKNFYFLGVKTPEEVNGILKNSLYMVHTCMPEGFGNNFIQAWLQGKPTVSLEFDPDGLITERKMGFISSGNENEFVEHCKLLISDEKLRNQLGENAFNFASKNFSLDQMIKKLEKIFKNIITS